MYSEQISSSAGRREADPAALREPVGNGLVIELSWGSMQGVGEIARYRSAQHLYRAVDDERRADRQR